MNQLLFLSNILVGSSGNLRSRERTHGVGNNNTSSSSGNRIVGFTTNVEGGRSRADRESK